MQDTTRNMLYMLTAALNTLSRPAVHWGFSRAGDTSNKALHSVLATPSSYTLMDWWRQRADLAKSSVRRDLSACWPGSGSLAWTAWSSEQSQQYATIKAPLKRWMMQRSSLPGCENRQ